MRYIFLMPGIIAILIGLHGAIPVSAQEQEKQREPSTQLEAFQAKTGVVIVRSYSTVGRIKAVGGVISVDAREFRDASDPSVRVTGISVSIKETSRLERENTSFIDADEIESLLQGLDYIAKASQETTKLEKFEIEYRTKSHFGVIVFNDYKGQLSVAVRSGRVGATRAYLDLSGLDELRKLIITAQSKL